MYLKSEILTGIDCLALVLIRNKYLTEFNIEYSSNNYKELENIKLFFDEIKLKNRYMNLKVIYDIELKEEDLILYINLEVN